MTDDTDLTTALTKAHRDLWLLRNAWDAAWAVGLDVTPTRGDDPRVRTSTGLDRPIPIRLDVDGNPRPSDLSTCWHLSVLEIAAATVTASELSWTDDNIAQDSVLPRMQSHVHLQPARLMHRHVSAAVRHAVRRDRAAELTFADDVHLRNLCAQVDRSLRAMPADLWARAPRPVRPTTKRCLGGPGRSACASDIPWTQTPGYCDVCAARLEALFDEHPGHRGSTCRNPWGQAGCRGRVKVPKYSLCDTCDEFRRRVIRQSDSSCIDCGETVQDRGFRCWACRQSTSRARKAG